jgi:hypothetical protein
LEKRVFGHIEVLVVDEYTLEDAVGLDLLRRWGTGEEQGAEKEENEESESTPDGEALGGWRERDSRGG